MQGLGLIWFENKIGAKKGRFFFLSSTDCLERRVSRKGQEFLLYQRREVWIGGCLISMKYSSVEAGSRSVGLAWRIQFCIDLSRHSPSRKARRLFPPHVGPVIFDRGCWSELGGRNCTLPLPSDAFSLAWLVPFFTGFLSKLFSSWPSQS